jgi:hypothetical protein
MSTLLVLGVLAVIALLAGRFGVDSRPKDPDCADTQSQWPFARHDS